MDTECKETGFKRQQNFTPDSFTSEKMVKHLKREARQGGMALCRYLPQPRYKNNPSAQ